MTAIDFEKRVCPNCGTADFSIRSKESLSGTCGINVFGANAIDWDGYTDVEWDTQRTDYFFCNECDTRLPDAWQEAIQRALDSNVTSMT